MQATSREALAAVQERFEQVIADLDGTSLRSVGGDLSGAARVLAEERVLRRHLADPAAPASARSGLAGGVFGGKLTDQATDMVREIAGSRWSRARDLVDAVELLAWQCLLTAAEREGTLDETEDELFRFGRVLESETRLREVLADVSVPLERRLELLHGLLDDKAGGDTVELLGQVVRSPRGRSLDVAAGQLAELAAARRERSVAQVRAAAALSPEQEERLAQVLSRIYGKTISVQVEVDPEVIGGMVVRVGDEVIDGSVASRLAEVSHNLPG